MAMTRTSKHPEVAVDFLLFLASREREREIQQAPEMDPDC